MSHAASPSPARPARSAPRPSTSSGAEPGRYEVVALGVGSSVDALIAQAPSSGPRSSPSADPAQRAEVAAALPFATVVDELADLADAADVVVNAVVGFAGLPVTVATLRAGKRLALANKESLIAAGPVVQPLRATPGAELVPVDTEHCAVHQCLRSSHRPGREVARIAAHGERRAVPRPHAPTIWRDVDVDEALAHPTWQMGPKITIDSCTLMNKGLEVIEAHELFGVAYDAIEVVVHPQSIVHSMVEFTDGVDDRPAQPARHAAADRLRPWPTRTASARRSAASTGRSSAGSTSSRPTSTTFRCLALAYEAGRAGGTAPAWLSAANEVAVEAFLAGRIRWTQIADVCNAALSTGMMQGCRRRVDDVVAADRRPATWRRAAVRCEVIDR